jgi:hypothetical protein
MDLSPNIYSPIIPLFLDFFNLRFKTQVFIKELFILVSYSIPVPIPRYRCLRNYRYIFDATVLRGTKNAGKLGCGWGSWQGVPSSNFTTFVCPFLFYCKLVFLSAALFDALSSYRIGPYQLALARLPHQYA